MTETWQIVSKHRAELMALSILWVIVFHFNTPPVITILDSFRSIGCGGVDIFFFLSGFGLCNSYYHRSGITSMNFYKRRFLRILPAYFLCIIVFGLIKSVPVTDLLWQMSCIGFWIHKPYYDWYVQSILLLYLVFPIFIKLARRYGIGKIVLFASILGLLPTLFFIYINKGTWILFTSRVPLFFIGAYAGYMLAESKCIRRPMMMIGISLIVFFVELYLARIYDYESMHRMGLYYLPQILIVPGACLFIAKILDAMPSIVLKTLKTLGAITLEIYLIHMSMRSIFPESKFILPILIAIAMHYGLNMFIKKIQKKKHSI